MRNAWILLGGLLLILSAPLSALAQDASLGRQTTNPMQAFEQLIGGEWHLDGSYQVFEWGPGRQSVRSRSYFLVEGEAKLVSEGMWYWHPGEGTIKGIFSAVDMPVALFEYVTRFEGNTMRSDLRTFSSDGTEEVFVETFEFTDDSHYVWKLLQDTPDGPTEIMSGTYSRGS